MELPRPPRWRTWLPALGLFAVTLAAYYPALHGGLVWDDDFHVTSPELRSWYGLYRIWFDVGSTLQHYPLLHTAFWVQHRLWGDATLGYHVVNVLLHVAAALMAGSILRRLAVPGAWLAAAIFALHPVHVESVAWIAELKNTLSTVFYLGAAMLYLRFDETRRKGLYGAALGVYGLALLSKTVTATLPGAMLVVFWWRRGRLSLRRDVLPLVPFAVIGAAAGLFTARWELEFNRTVGPEFGFTLVERVLIAGRAIWFHLGKLFWPSGLAFIYPRWHIDATAWWQFLFPVGVVALAAVFWTMRGWSRGPLAGLLFFAGSLFPVLGFFNLYTFRYSLVANHYQYLASLGIIALTSAGLARLLGRLRLWGRPGGYAACALLLAALSGLTWAQSRQFSSAETLYRTTIRLNPGCWLAYNNLGNILLTQGKPGEAMEAFRQALEHKPDLATAHNGLGTALVNQGDVAGGIESYRRATELDPRYAEAFNNLGVALGRARRYEEAIATYRQCLAIDPARATAHYNLANALARLDRLAEAELHYREAIRINPDMAFGHYHLGILLLSQGRHDEALGPLDAAFRLKPDFFQGRYEVGNLLLRQGRLEEAVTSYEKALALQPGSAEAHANLGTALAQQGRLDNAEAHYREALRIRPDYAIAANNLGRVLEELGRRDEAIELYRRVLASDANDATARANLEQALGRARQAEPRRTRGARSPAGGAR